MQRTRTILFAILFFLICPQISGNPENRQEASGPVHIVFLPDIQFNDPFADSSGLNLKMDHLLTAVAETNPSYVIIGNHSSDQAGKNPIKEAVIYQSDIYYSRWIDNLSQFNFTWYTVFNETNLGGAKWHDHKSVIFKVYQDQYLKFFKMPRTGGEDGTAGLQYWVANGDVLLVVLNAYNQPVINNGNIMPNLGDAQLTWLANTLKYHPFYPCKIVVSSAGEVINYEKDLLPILKEHDVDYFFSFDEINVNAEVDGMKIINLGSPDGYPEVLSYYLLSVDPARAESSFVEILVDEN